MSATLLAYAAQRNWSLDLAAVDRIDLDAATVAIAALTPEGVHVVVSERAGANLPDEVATPAPSEAEALRTTLARERGLFIERERVVREQQAASAARILELEGEAAQLRLALQEAMSLATAQQRTLDELRALVSTLREQQVSQIAPEPTPASAHETPPEHTPPPILSIPVSGTREGMDLARYATLHGVPARYDLKRGAVVADTDLSAIHAAWQQWKEPR